MADTTFPASSGSGASVLETTWSRMQRALGSNGVVRMYYPDDTTLNTVWNVASAQTALKVTAGAGTTVSVAAGHGKIMGFDFIRDLAANLVLDTEDPTNPRIDLVVMRLTWGPPASISIVAIKGTAAASPSAPSPVRTDAATWDEKLAEVRLNSGGGGGGISSVTDRRRFVVLGQPPECRLLRSSNQSIASSTLDATTTIDFTSAGDELVDTDNMHSTSSNSTRLPCTIPGNYDIRGCVSFAANATGERYADIILNGSVLIGQTRVPADAVASAPTTVPVDGGVYRLSIGDYLEMRTYQTSGSPLNVLSVNYYSPRLTAKWAGD